MVADSASCGASARWAAAIGIALAAALVGTLAAAQGAGETEAASETEAEAEAAVVDAGVASGPDAGVAFADAGAAFADAGVAFADAGVAFVDAGVAFADAGAAFADTEHAEPWEPEPQAAVGARGIPPAELARLQIRGAAVYRRYCASCHGRRGDGQGAASRYLSVPARDLTSGVYKWRTTPSGQLPTDGDLLRTIRRGVPGTKMPPWQGRLPARDLRAVVQYVETLSPRFAEEPPPTPLPMPTEVPPLDETAVARGRQIYVLMQCWTCHGMDGRGDGPAADTLEDDEGNPIEAYDFTEGEYRGGRRPIDIYRTFTTGVNGTPMPQYHEALMVGRDGFEDLSSFEEVLSGRELSGLEAFVARMPTTQDIWQWPEPRRLKWTARRRWDLVAYVLALSRGTAAGRYLWAPPYRTR